MPRSHTLERSYRAAFRLTKLRSVPAFDAIRENAFEIEFLTLKFKGSGGLVVSWILSTMLGWLIIGKFWNNG
jgi:hypothetical protein